MEVVINTCYGGFGLSDKAMELYLARGGVTPGWSDTSIGYRSNPILVGVVRELGDEANDNYAALKIIAVPDDVEVEIGEYDGIEWVAEKHRVWR